MWCKIALLSSKPGGGRTYTSHPIGRNSGGVVVPSALLPHRIEAYGWLYTDTQKHAQSQIHYFLGCIVYTQHTAAAYCYICCGVVCLCVCVSATLTCPAKTAEPTAVASAKRQQVIYLTCAMVRAEGATNLQQEYILRHSCQRSVDSLE